MGATAQFPQGMMLDNDALTYSSLRTVTTILLYPFHRILVA